MISFFKNVSRRAESVASDIEARVVLMAGLRQLLQVVAYGLLEWVATRTPDPSVQPSDAVLEALHAPTDGALVDAVDSLLVTAEQNGWAGAYRVLMTPIPESNACIDLCTDYSATVSGLLQAMVALRNDGGEGHGLPGGYRRSAECAAFDTILDALKPVLPVKKGDEVEIGPDGRGVQLRMLRVYHGRPCLIRRIQEVNSAVVRVKAQRYNDAGSVEKQTYEAINAFSKFAGQILPTLKTYQNSWIPLYYLPDRVTDTFTGRDAEKGALVDWLNDDDSRACLVYGDGGVGKTTLVLEVLHQVLDEDIQVSWKPKVISFYTAKRSQFGINGITPVGIGRPHLMDLMAHVYTLLFAKRPDKAFYKRSVADASVYLQQAASSSLSLQRNDHLIVIDNAETLIESVLDRDELGKQLKEISRRVGRVLMTSRRREVLGAEPIEIKPLSSVDAVSFIRNRGQKKLHIGAVEHATDKDLFGVVDELEKRPIVLQAFLNALSDPTTGTLIKAKNRVLGMLHRDLGEFLFSDVWARVSKSVRKLLILMSKIADVHDGQSFRICADVCEVPVHEAETALAESNGIASVIYVDGELQVAFSRNFLDFCKDKEGPSEQEIDLARRRYSQFLSRASSFTGDRVAEAFRTPVARAAHCAKQDGDTDAALSLYSQAALADSANGWLFDRYAYFLFHDVHDNKAALHQARRATELLPGEGEVWYTRGLIEARLGEFRSAESSLSKARQLGISEIRCAMQLAWGYLKARPRPQLELASRQLHFLDIRTGSSPTNSRDRVEVGHIRERLASLRARYG